MVKRYIKLFEQFNDEESWWDEESPFDEDKLDFKRGDMVFIIRGGGQGQIGIIIDVGDRTLGIGNNRMYYACKKEDVRRLTKEEVKEISFDDQKNKFIKKDLGRW